MSGEDPSSHRAWPSHLHTVMHVDSLRKSTYCVHFCALNQAPAIDVPRSSTAIRRNMFNVVFVLDLHDHFDVHQPLLPSVPRCYSTTVSVIPLKTRPQPQACSGQLQWAHMPTSCTATARTQARLRTHFRGSTVPAPALVLFRRSACVVSALSLA
jgi:hypothetical protein